MSPRFPRRAVIDVGTNSVKLLVADVEGGVVTPVFETSEQTRLGRGFYAERRLQPEAIAATAAVVAGFRTRAQELGAGCIRVVATSAVREAGNREELLDAVAGASDLGVEVLSGDAEAALGFRGVCSDPRLAGRALLVAELGGGSMQFMLGRDGTRWFDRSFALGSVRLFEVLRPGSAPAPAALAECRAWLDGFFERTITPAVGPALALAGAVMFVVTGGTALILARIAGGWDRYDRAVLEEVTLEAEVVTRLTERLWSLPIEDRRRLPGLPPDRADIMLTGAAILEASLRALRLPALRPSTRGLRFGAVMEDGTSEAGSAAEPAIGANEPR